MNSEKSVADVYVVADNIISPLGKTTGENFGQLKENKTSVKQHQDKVISPEKFYASLFNADDRIIDQSEKDYTKFEQLLIASVGEALLNLDLPVTDNKTIFIISSTKGNIGLLGTADSPELQKRISLFASAKLVADRFGFINKPVIISNACISGSMAIITGMRLLRSGQYENAVIAGADVISEFIMSGFESFKALSPALCKPFDRSHDGLNLGEGAGTIILSTQKKYSGNIKVRGGAVSNDANHISGPSRTGEELAYAIEKAIQDAAVSSEQIDFISAHGTATVYNDEMEAKAFYLSGLQNTPLNSLKGYFGHTLGAAGVIEVVVSIQSLKENIFLPTMGFEEIDAINPLNVSTESLNMQTNNFLKTASGFGGCNAAVIFGK